MAVSIAVSSNAAAPIESFIPKAHEWVKLRNPISEYSADEALLLCEASEDCWVAWVPGYGEARLNRQQLLQPE
ncbi:hypothetical protein IQ241_11185 [Romeria aff. gracilis LEGE 07310]|uniref:Uncharacterized protein n=1 Tax=Vasconcelosia minhoensis LEGE 07310 TaxID=915328 RepID=A0A8J7AMU1_9CYAN|nr:hypothetical protein [Romeria gracilis]MBE9077850.1 hypothetical protein [Romeria aff. gracilis LEGE 07310]